MTTTRSEHVAALLDVRSELARWGWGDCHYGPQPQEQSVRAALAKLDAVIVALGGAAKDSTWTEVK